MIRRTLFALMLGVTPAAAEDVALIVGNGSYANARNLRGADDLVDTAGDFERAGFRVFRGEDLGDDALLRLASEFARAADGSGRIVIALAGHFAQSEGSAWFLATDARRPDLVTAGNQGLSLAVLYEIAARAPGRAVLLLGSEDRDVDLGAGLSIGSGALAVPQGVAVIRGDAGEMAAFAEDSLLVPGASLVAALQDHTDLAGEGFLSASVPFLGAPEAEAERPRRTDERTAWARALATNTIEAYEAFARDFPDSATAPLALAAIERLRPPADPLLAARQAEEALRLTRDQRRAVQRNLSLLDFNTRGIDGIFGPATRTAVGNWQRTNSYEATTYLTREQIDRIDAQAARRARELEAEAAARQAEQERQDRAYWRDTGALGDEAGLRAYLRRYPDGLYAEIAQERLRPYDEAAQAEAAAADRAAWERATERDDVAAYREYLQDQPQGAFRERAEDRIAELTRNDDNAAARAEEALGLNSFTRNLIESRLEALRLRPGRVDGVFDDDTRRAIRRYQQARNLRVTGYLSQETVVRLLADSVLR
jgi:peptidoglycan hydrolase-like protein with peptidoglycan-binding domain